MYVYIVSETVTIFFLNLKANSPYLKMLTKRKKWEIAQYLKYEVFMHNN